MKSAALRHTHICSKQLTKQLLPTFIVQQDPKKQQISAEHKSGLEKVAGKYMKRVTQLARNMKLLQANVLDVLLLLDPRLLCSLLLCQHLRLLYEQ